MARLSCTLILCLLAVGSAAAQQMKLRLTVVDLLTDRPIAYAAVQLSPGNTGGTSDRNGRVTLRTAAGDYALRASITGYAPFQDSIRLDQDLEAVLRLEPTAEQLTTVTVTESTQRDALTRPAMGVERLTTEDLESIPTVLGERDVLKSLQLTAGVSSAGEASNGVSVRGGTIDQNLLLYDGAPVFTPTHLFGLFSVFTPDAVGTADLYRGNIPARYGGRVASVLDVRSRSPNTERTVISGGVGFVSSHLSVETPLDREKRIGLLLAVRGGIQDYAFPLVARLERTRSRFADGTLKLRYRAGERDFLTLTSFYSTDFNQLDLVSQSAALPATVNQYAYRTLNGGIEHFHLFREALSLTSELHRASYRAGLRFPQEDGGRIDFLSGIDYTTLKSGLTYRTDKHRATGGWQADHYTLRPGELDPGAVDDILSVDLDKERALELVAYVQDEWTVNNRLTVSGGLRYVNYRQLGPGEIRSYEAGPPRASTRLETRLAESGETIVTYGGLEPRLGVNYSLNDHLSLKASYARTRQYLQNIYNATSPLPTSRYKVSDVNVVPQTANLFSAGLSGRTTDGAYYFQLETYYRRIDDLLEYRPGADFFLNPAVETDLLRGEGRGYGVELTARRETGRVTGEVNYTYSRSENLVVGDSPAFEVNRGAWYPGYFDQPHALTARMVIDEGKTHELGFNFVVQSNRPYTAPNGFVTVGAVPVPLFLERNNDRLPVYHRLDFSWTIQNFRRTRRRWTGEWVFTVYNVYGRDNAYNIFFQARDRNTPPLGIFSKSPFAAYRLSIFGAPIFSLSYNFKFVP